ncbi:DEAD/DEAH box helicase [Aureibacter tunicatorum]|uniref:Superfamily I DNA and/or RNA helicase n=1 Tax=Aureibacter tunicatorum TaxID=866807 RepID=A0AAE4BRQ1_9BACT|nr:AAA domain-containing protein [Aureibacter tunicatorum]MDR6238901.1 superfamily I DNA and/or RNA helicase [Aureibacter tunicatorum]BDD05172.1 hypothetical protein AUTU_26550 [Aureibacter tunicatorum]
MSFNPEDFYSYFKECYKLDYKEYSVNNIFLPKYQFKWFVSRYEELLTHSLPYIPYAHKKIEDLEKEIELYRLEKKLFYACFFILGKSSSLLSKDKRICAPLLLFPANIVTVDDEKYLEIEKDEVLVNQSILSKLELKDQSLTKDLFIKDISELIKNLHENCTELVKLLDKYFINLDTEELLLHPKVWPASKIRKHLSNADFEEGEYTIVPAAGTALLDKSKSTLKVVNDLNEIINKGTFNTSLNNLLQGNANENEFQESLYKSRLNTEQAKALENAYRFDNSVIVGPPGTGKSYTITSIISDLVANNQSVLVVSKTKQAVEVLRSMLIDDFKLKDYLIHTTGTQYKASLKAKIRKYLSGILSKTRHNLDEKKIKNQYLKLQKLENSFEELVDNELLKSDLEFSSDLSFLDKLKKLYFNSRFSQNTDIWKVFDDIGHSLKKLDHEVSSFSKRKIQANIKENSNIYRRDISLFHDALDSHSFTEYKERLEDVYHSNILKVFPIWLVNLADLNTVLPLQKELFDVVIIDEATQCDVSIALPAIYRAKRTIIAGDPNQLRHYSFVAKSQQLELQEKFNLPNDKLFDFRNRSILDFYISKVAQQDQITFLREHFRSTPSLIEFSNQTFYDGQLEVIKSTPKHTTYKQIELIRLDGKRDQKGVNKEEALAIIKKLRLIMKEHLNSSSLPTVGIISPFSQQVNYINKLLRENFGLDELKKFDIFCGTPYSFQGSEREIILLSFCLCDQSHHSAFVHANKPEVLNVAITRAKSYQYVFTSIAEHSNRKTSLLLDYFNFIKSFSHTIASEQEQDEFQKDVLLELGKAFDEIKCGYPVAGSLLDILITHNGSNYFIDLIGYPGIFREALSLERYKTLSRTGIKCLPLPYSYWKNNKKESVERITKLIKM